MSSEPGARPRLRLLHHLARSGGTVISRCLATMDGVVLLSEIHPLGRRMFDPLLQAHTWYRLLTPADIECARSGALPFDEAIALIARRCEEQHRLLVIRDWSHLDYTGIPFAVPVFRSRLAAALEARFELVRSSTVRHPLDQWLSLCTKPAFEGRLDPSRYLYGVERFARAARTTGFTRYEDFTSDPDTALTALCAALEIPFDAAYRNRWAAYSNITGDVVPSRAGDTIRPLPRPAIAKADLERFRAIPAYGRIVEQLRYDA